ncbi:hypothetical protein [Pseudonocardia phyllosphaerae]|uniref:hypothetical protein n=1 Tax=Pseudonocardia phyllosphaerae TaxID=3390502 RepID=UPI00397C83CA
MAPPPLQRGNVVHMDSHLLTRPDPGGLLRRDALRGSGHSDDEIDRLIRTGVLVPVRRGTYRLASAEPPATSEAMHALRARAAAPDLAPDAVFGFATAAVLLGLPLWRVRLDTVHLLRPRPNGARTRGGLQVHSGRLPPDDVAVLDGLRVTTAARTAVDLARTLAPEQALVPLDAALQRAVVATRTARHDPAAATSEQVTEVLLRTGRTHGAPAARRLLALADPLCESPGESRSRLRMHLAGLPAPVTQWPVPGTSHRADFAWPELGVVGEFDGRLKYGRSLRPGDDVNEVLWREKRREDRIRETGLGVIRWIWLNIDDDGPDGMVPRLGRLLLGPGFTPLRRSSHPK